MRNLKHFVRPKAPTDSEPEENFVPKEHLKRNFQYKWSRKWEKHNQRPTSVQLGHDTSLRNTRFNVKKDVCMLKNRKGPSPSRAPQSIVPSEPSRNPCNIYSIYKKKLNNEPQHEQSEFLRESENDLTNDSRGKFINEARRFSYKNQFWGKKYQTDSAHSIINAA